eukprot:m.13232 g.13232  ORF g.13232 m.13232 type:complete len:140 (+) comp24561_c0_seq1:455-874(+)
MRVLYSPGAHLQSYISMAMKLVVCLFLVLVKASSAADSNTTPLQCYSCTFTSASSCTEIETCLDGQEYCQTVKAKLPYITGSRYLKHCVTNCAEVSKGSSTLGGVSTYCCQTNLCNAGKTVKVSIVALMLTVLVAFLVA